MRKLSVVIPAHNEEGSISDTVTTLHAVLEKYQIPHEIVVVNDGRKILEASGGITENNIVKFAASGVDFISVGQITHHIQSIDISLKIK